MIFGVWMLALVISLAQLMWKDETWKARIEDKKCTGMKRYLRIQKNAIDYC